MGIHKWKMAVLEWKIAITKPNIYAAPGRFRRQNGF
jgi:hypothetical protein